jgi:CHRD domain
MSLAVYFEGGNQTMTDNALFRRTILALAGLTCLAWVGSASAATVSFTVSLTGADEMPPLTTAGKGTADLTWEPSTRVVTWDITSSGLTGQATMAHFHNGPAGQNGPVVIWLTKKGTSTSGAIKGKATLTEAQAKQFEAGDWYINVHTKAHSSGEIRGQVKPPKS